MIMRKIIRFVHKRILPKEKIRTGQEKYITNLKESPVDDRDKDYEVKVMLEDRPVKIDMSSYCQPIKQQGRIGSCGSHAICTAMETIVAVQRKEDKVVPLSERFHYYIVRDDDYEGTYPLDSGQYLRDGLSVALHEGISPEKLCVYDVYKYNNKPTMFSYSFARWFKIKSYNRCWDLVAIKQSLSENKPVIAGFLVQQDWITTGFSGNVQCLGQNIGGHAVCIIGYNDTHANPDKTIGAFKFANSWSKNWGANGFGWISYTNAQKKLMEAWTVMI